MFVLSGNITSDTSLHLNLRQNSLTTLEEAVYGDIFPFIGVFYIDGEKFHISPDSHDLFLRTIFQI